MTNMNEGPFEIERKFLIEYPSETALSRTESSNIVQTYLQSEKGVTERVRKREYPDKTLYYHTKKIRISNVRCVELEDRISETEYEELLLRADPDRNTIYKTRYCLPVKDHLFEIDIYPFWKDRAVMEVELKSEEELFSFPNQITVLKEITDDKRYKNAALARTIPYDEL